MVAFCAALPRRPGLHASVAVIMLACVFKLDCEFFNFFSARSDTAQRATTAQRNPSRWWVNPDMHLLQEGLRLEEDDLVNYVKEEEPGSQTKTSLAASGQAASREKHRPVVTSLFTALERERGAAEKQQPSSSSSSSSSAPTASSLLEAEPALLQSRDRSAEGGVTHVATNEPSVSLLVLGVSARCSALVATFYKTVNEQAGAYVASMGLSAVVEQYVLIVCLLGAFCALACFASLAWGENSHPEASEVLLQQNGSLLAASGAGVLKGPAFVPRGNGSRDPGGGRFSGGSAAPPPVAGGGQWFSSAGAAPPPAAGGGNGAVTIPHLAIPQRQPSNSFPAGYAAAVPGIEKFPAPGAGVAGPTYSTLHDLSGPRVPPAQPFSLTPSLEVLKDETRMHHSSPQLSIEPRAMQQQASVASYLPLSNTTARPPPLTSPHLSSSAAADGRTSAGSAATSGLPPPLCPALVLPVSEARFAVPLQALTRVDPKGFDILGLSGNPLLHAAFRRSAAGSTLEVAMAHAHSSPRATVGPVSTNLDDGAASDGPVSGWDIRGPNGAFYGMLIPLASGAHVVQVGGGVERQNPGGSGSGWGAPAPASAPVPPPLGSKGSTKAAAGRQVMVIEGDIASKRLSVTSSGGRTLAAVSVARNASDAELLELRVHPNVDGILVLSCVLAVILLAPGSSVADPSRERRMSGL